MSLIQLSWGSVGLLLVLAYFVWEFLWYQFHKRGMQGPVLPLPVFGFLFEMIYNPVKFWEDQHKYNPNGISAHRLFNKMMYFVSNTELCKQIFQKVHDYVLVAHPNAAWLLGEHNMIYLDPDTHKAFRTNFLTGLFSKPAMNIYLQSFERVIREHMDSLCEETKSGPVEIRYKLRDMAACASQMAFVGPYLKDKQQQYDFIQDFQIFTLGFLGIPVRVKGTALQKALDARARILAVLEPCVQASRKHMEAGGEPRCALDFWQRDVLDNKADKPDDYKEIADAMLDMLFAAQDATTSSVVWTIYTLHKFPKVVEKIRAEVEEVTAQERKEREAEGNSAPVAIADVFEKLPYLQNVSVEILRYRPPVPMVPHAARHDVQLGQHSIPKGSLVIPSITCAAQTEADWNVFNPDKPSDRQFNKVLVFGSGAHKCPGRLFASNEVAMLAALLARDYSWTCAKLSESEYIYFPTLFPADSVFAFAHADKAQAQADAKGKGKEGAASAAVECKA